MTSTLPLALRVWEPELRALSGPFVSAIAPWLGLLSAAMGPLGRDRPEALGEPDGFSALSRRGSYERLLTSEWALADAAPDEFLRRAAGGEHLFLALARRAPTAHERTIVVFDAGPWQLGTPRLAHVALAIVFARRAREAGASFAWGVLQNPGAGLREGLDVEALLESRSVTDVDDAALDAWSALLASSDATDAWAVAAPRTSAALAARGLHALAIDTPCDLEPEPLRLRIDRRRYGPLELELPLPSAIACVQAMREPTRPSRGGGAPAHVDAFWLSIDGHRVFTVAENAIVSWPLPPSARATAPRPRRLAYEGTLLAVASASKSVVALTMGQGSDGLEVRALGALAEHVVASPEDFRSCDRRTPAWLVRPFVGSPRLLVLIGGTLRDATDNMRILAESVLAVVPERDRVLIVRGAEDGTVESARVVRSPFAPGQQLFQPDGRDILAVAQLAPDASRVSRVLVAHASQVTHIALETGERTWDLIPGGNTPRRTLFAPEGTEVVALGVAHREPGLVVLENDRRHITLLAKSVARPIATASGPIAEISGCAAGRSIAWRTESGWLEVASVEKAEIVLRISSPRADA